MSQIPRMNESDASVNNDRMEKRFYHSALKSEIADLRTALDKPCICSQIERAIPGLEEAIYRTVAAFRKLIEHIHALKEASSECAYQRNKKTRAAKRRAKKIQDLLKIAESLASDAETICFMEPSPAQKRRDRLFARLEELHQDLRFVEQRPGVFAPHYAVIRPMIRGKIEEVSSLLSRCRGARKS